MTYPIGSIILIKQYQLPTEIKDKYFIVLEKEGNEYNFLSMTTSKFYFSPLLIKRGIINKDGGASMYCFEKNQVIGKNGFSFPLHTFVNHNSNIHQFSFELLSEYEVQVLDILIDKELIELLYSFLKYKGTPRKYKPFLESVLNRVCK